MLHGLAEQLSLFRLPAPPPATAQRAQGVLQLGQAIVPYELRRGARRRLTLTITEQGLRIGASLTLPLATIEHFAKENADWIQRKLAEQAGAPRPQPLTVQDGCRLPVLDGEALVRVLPGNNRCRWVGDTLVLETREARDPAKLNLLARRALQKRALTHFGERLQHFAPQLELTVPAYGLSSARTRWGSCSTRSGIRLNWRLIHLPAHLGDYVVVHELAHLHQMDHSPRFWAIVARAYPDWSAARAQLKALARTLPII